MTNAKPIRNDEKMFFYGEVLEGETWKQNYLVTEDIVEIQNYFLSNPSKEPRRIVGYWQTILGPTVISNEPR